MNWRIEGNKIRYKISRIELEHLDNGGVLSQSTPRTIYFKQKRKDQRENYKTPTLAIPQSRRLISTNTMSKVSLSLDPNLCHGR